MLSMFFVHEQSKRVPKGSSFQHGSISEKKQPWSINSFKQTQNWYSQCGEIGEPVPTRGSITCWFIQLGCSLISCKKYNIVYLH